MPIARFGTKLSTAACAVSFIRSLDSSVYKTIKISCGDYLCTKNTFRKELTFNRCDAIVANLYCDDKIACAVNPMMVFL